MKASDRDELLIRLDESMRRVKDDTSELKHLVAERWQSQVTLMESVRWLTWGFRLIAAAIVSLIVYLIKGHANG